MTFLDAWGNRIEQACAHDQAQEARLMAEVYVSLICTPAHIAARRNNHCLWVFIEHRARVFSSDQQLRNLADNVVILRDRDFTLVHIFRGVAIITLYTRHYQITHSADAVSVERESTTKCTACCFENPVKVCVSRTCCEQAMKLSSRSTAAS